MKFWEAKPGVADWKERYNPPAEDEMTQEALTIELTELPEPMPFAAGIRRAPDRGYSLNRHDTKVALANALRYIPVEHHRVVAPEFLEELRTMGRIYGYRYRPAGR
jgi:urocanate hydratase